MLADPVLPGVHQSGDLGEAGAAFGVGDGGGLDRPWPSGSWDECAGPVPDAGDDNGGQVAGVGQVPFADRGGQNLGGIQAGQLRSAQGPPQPPGLRAGLAPVLGRQAGREQIAVASLVGRGDLVGPDRMQNREVVRIGQGVLPSLGRGQLLAVSVQHPGQHGERVSGASHRDARLGCGQCGDLVVAGQFWCGPRARHRVGELRGDGEHVGHVGVGAVAERDVSVLAVLSAGDHGQARVHSAALRGVIGDRVAQLRLSEMLVQEGAVGPSPLPGGRIGVQGPADDQPGRSDRLDAEQVAVGQRSAGLPRLDAVVVASADDQVPDARSCAVADPTTGPAWTAPRRIRSSRMRRDSSRRSA